MTRNRRRTGVVLVGVALAIGLPSAADRVQAQEPPESPGASLVEVCEQSGLGAEVCKSFDSGSVAFAEACSELPLPPEACASATDGRVIDPTLIDEWEKTWVARALRLQAGLDDGEPLRNVLLPHTHNSSNSTANATSVSNIDPNQRYSIFDQMRMGIRGVELDLHWVLNPAGTPETGGKAVVLCHGRSEAVGPVTIHLGCSVDRPFAAGLGEIRDFLALAGNEDEVVLLYLENQLEDDPVAHEQAAAILEAELGDLVYRPPAGQPCAPMPLDLSRADIRASGARILIVGNCGPGSWENLVHERGPAWDERGVGDGYPSFPECLAERTERDYDANWIRVFEDSTWLSAMVEGVSPGLTPEATTAAVRCGVDMIGFDRLEPFDGRLEALVWSWARDEPAQDPSRGCTAWGTDARFRAAGCEQDRGYACKTGAGEWVVPPDRGPWATGVAVCESVGAAFATPSTGWDNERLRAVAPTGTELWLDYEIVALSGGRAAPAEISGGAATGSASLATGADSQTGSMPATGSSPPLPAAVALLITALAVSLAARPPARNL